MTTQKIKPLMLEGVLLDSLPELSSLATSGQSALERLAQRLTTALRILTGRKEQEKSAQSAQLARECLARQLARDLRRKGAVMPGDGGFYRISPRVLSKEILNGILHQYDRDPVRLSKAQMLELAVSLEESLSCSEHYSHLYEEELLYILDEKFPQTEEAD